MTRFLPNAKASLGLLKGPTLRIGCSSGFWGDTATSAPQLVRRGNIDFLVSDYLSEITMSLLTAMKQKSSNMGYTPDFLQACMKSLLKELKRKGIKVVSNAGGVNPIACSEALAGLAREQGVDLNVATVVGDDLLGKLNTTELETLLKGPDLQQPSLAIQSLNAYLGAFPIAKALDYGADVVVTGRCVDSALTLGPLIHKFHWTENDLDQLAAGSLAGHLVECGAQVTGGIFTDWHKIDGWDNIGFPIIECDSSGRFFITKPLGTGGQVNTATVSEQLVYEIGDPSAYLLPDVSCDFSNVQLQQLEDNIVMVTGAKGNSPPLQYKVSGTYADGYRAIAVCPVIGPNAAAKAKKTAENILQRTRNMFKHLELGDYSKIHIQILGSEDSYGHHAQLLNSREVVLWIGVQHTQKLALELFAKEIAPAGTGMAPGLTTLIGGRPTVSPVLRLFSFLYPKSTLPISIYINGKTVATLKPEAAVLNSSHTSVSSAPELTEPSFTELLRGSQSFRIEQLAFLRSGDKGDTVNIGVIARQKKFLPYLQEALTPLAIRKYFEHLLEPNSIVERYELPGICALNFVITHALGGGGVSSLRCDPQGKAYAQMLADFTIKNMPNIELL